MYPQIRQVVFFFIVLLTALQTNAQEKRERLLNKIFYEKQGGNFSLGVRNTVSLFNHGNWREIGTGVGGHFRLQLADRVNTEWFADVLPANIQNKASRMDYHVGWSVMFYLLNTKSFTRKLTPYVLAGHCFDITNIRINGENGDHRSRFSSAVQAGLGCHYNITPRFDISLAAQYMIHLGKELHAEENEAGEMEIELHKNAGWEGHLLLTLSVNYKIYKLWNRKAS
ncbi:MAG: hypothetical protein IPP77_10120 [Bacteroidetes bacterium]|nr:hypothetical protein [Bacteroidota bacterium]